MYGFLDWPIHCYQEPHVSQDHYADRLAQLARARALAGNYADYERRLGALVYALTGEMTSYRRRVLLGAWAQGAEWAARKAEREA